MEFPVATLQAKYERFIIRNIYQATITEYQSNTTYLLMDRSRIKIVFSAAEIFLQLVLAKLHKAS